jgi:hypothetical protein
MERLKQPLSFEGLDLGNGRSPTDFDMVVDIAGEFWAVGECKVKGNPLGKGQRSAIEHACQNHRKAGVVVLGFVFEHTVPPEEKIVAADCKVIEVWVNGTWRPPSRPHTVGSLLNVWVPRCDAERAKRNVRRSRGRKCS